MTMEATSPELAASAQVSTYAPEQSLLVACLLSMSGGFLDAFTWLSLGGVFANSQTGNVVFGMNAAPATGTAAHHVPPIRPAALRAPWVRPASKRRCSAFGAKLCADGGHCCCTGCSDRLRSWRCVRVAQSASFRQIERWKYLSVGDRKPAPRRGQLISTTDPSGAGREEQC